MNTTRQLNLKETIKHTEMTLVPSGSKERSIEDLTSLEIRKGLEPLSKRFLDKEQTKILNNELEILFACRQEPLPKDLDKWLISMRQMGNMDFTELIKRIRVARFTKRFGTHTTLADIIASSDKENIDEQYNKYFKPIRKKKYDIELICTCGKTIAIMPVFRYENEKLKNDIRFPGLDCPLCRTNYTSEHISCKFGEMLAQAGGETFMELKL